jgi:uncharacterized LabA/DUF88 family protein
MSFRRDKLALFIDGANGYATVTALGFDIDYKRPLREFQGWGTMVRAYFLTKVHRSRLSHLGPLFFHSENKHSDVQSVFSAQRRVWHCRVRQKQERGDHVGVNRFLGCD